MLEEQVFIIVMVILLVTIVGGGVSAWFKFTESIESDIEYRAAVKVAHRLAGSSQCLTYLSTTQRASKNVLDANKLKLANEIYGSDRSKGLVSLGGLLGLGSADGNLPREHPCAFLMGFRWQAHVVDLEFFNDMEEEPREKLSERYGCLLAKDSCLWDMGKPFSFTPRLEHLEAKDAEERSDEHFCSGQDWCASMKNSLDKCLSKGDEDLKGLTNPTAPVKIPITIAITNEIGQLEKHMGYLQVVVIPSDRHCTREDYGERAFYMGENKAIIGKECCLFDLQEGVCRGNLRAAHAVQAKFARTVYIFSGVGTLANLITGHCPEYEYLAKDDYIACGCENKGQPMEAIGIDGPQVVGTGCPRNNFFAVKVQNRNWEKPANVKAIKLTVGGNDYLPCTKDTCGLPTGTVWVKPSEDVDPRSVATYVFGVPAEGLSGDEVEVTVTMEYSVPKISSPYKKPKECRESGHLYVCTHTLKATYPATGCIGEGLKDACMGQICSKDQVCCSAGGCISKERKNHCEAAVTGWDSLKKEGEALMKASLEGERDA